MTLSIRPVKSQTGVSYDLDEFVENVVPILRAGSETDLSLVRLNPRKGNRFPSVLKYFITKDQLNTLVGRRIVLTVSGTDTWENNFGNITRLTTQTMPDGKTFADTIHADISTISGDCGGFYIFDDNFSSRKLCGLHCASTSCISSEM